MLETILRWGSLLTAAITAIFTFVTFFSTWGNSFVQEIKFKNSIINEIKVDKKRTEKLEEKITSALRQFSAITEIPETAKVNIQLKEFSDQAQNLDERLKVIEGLAITNPEKALSLAILQKEVGTISSRMERFEKDISTQVSSISGRIDTILIALFGAALSILLFTLPWAIAHLKSKTKD